MKAVAEASKMEKGEEAKPWLAEAANWLPEKIRQVRVFFAEVKAELKKVTWPAWKAEVWPTTVVVIATTVFFGFYLFGIDLVLSQLFRRILGQ